MSALGALTNLGMALMFFILALAICGLVYAYYKGKHAGKVEERGRGKNVAVSNKKPAARFELINGRPTRVKD
jgi:hypothetical protein